MICNEVTSGGNDKNLARLAQTCKALYRFVIPVVYREIKNLQPYLDTIDPWVRDWNTAVGVSGARLLRPLFSNPDMGHIQSIEIRGIAGDFSTSQGVAYSDLYAVQHTAVLQLFGKNLTSRFELNPAISLLFLFLSPKPTSFIFSMHPGSRDTSFLLHKPARTALKQPRYTHTHLTNLNIRYHDLIDHPGADLHKLNGLLHTVPNFTHLTVHGARSGTIASWLPPLANLTALQLHKTFVSADYLRKLMGACTKLVCFELAQDQNSTALPVGCGPISAAEVLVCLQPSAGTLRKLRVETWRLAAPKSGVPVYSGWRGRDGLLTGLGK